MLNEEHYHIKDDKMGRIHGTCGVARLREKRPRGVHRNRWEDSIK
jgi:hypothetical protein